MTYGINITPDGPILRVQIEGTVRRGLGRDDLATVKRLMTACTEYGCMGILLDISRASLEVDIVDMYQVGNALAARMIPGIRIAAFPHSKNADGDSFFQLVSQNRGILYRAFDAEADAVKWLNANHSS
ncbi:MAG: hypothetical protein P8181_05475 [bacterium]